MRELQIFRLTGNSDGTSGEPKRHCVPKMRTRAKMKVVASDRARRPNVPRHILFNLQKQFLRIAGVNFQKKRANGDIILYNNICEK